MINFRLIFVALKNCETNPKSNLLEIILSATSGPKNSMKQLPRSRCWSMPSPTSTDVSGGLFVWQPATDGLPVSEWESRGSMKKCRGHFWQLGPCNDLDPCSCHLGTWDCWTNLQSGLQTMKPPSRQVTPVAYKKPPASRNTGFTLK